MKNQVVVTGKNGNVIVKSEPNAEYGYIRVQQTRMVVDESGFARTKTLSALIPGKVKDLENFGWEEGEEVQGRIVVKESTIPFTKKDPDRDLKIAGESMVVCMLGDEPIYRKHFYSMSSSAEDILITHTNKEEIEEAYAQDKAEEEVSDSSNGDEFRL